MPIYFFAFCLFFLISCTNSTPELPPVSDNQLDKKAVLLSHATNFEIEKEGKHTILTIKSAWKNSKEQFQYLLYPKNEAAPTTHPNALKIPVPVERIICSSTVDIAYLDFLEAGDKIVAVANGGYIYNPLIRKKIEDKTIVEIGGTNTIDYEKALTTNADIALVYSIGDQEMYKKFKEMDIPPVMLSDFMETTPLGRAEWALFVAYLLGKEELAQSKFEKIAQQYQTLKEKAAGCAKQPTVLTGAVYKGTWYVAGGKSLMATFIKDAGAKYLWEQDQTVSGVPLDFEAVYAKALEVDYWINMSHISTKEALGKAEQKYQDFKAFQEGRLYNYYKRASDNGGSDIFESAIVQPHRVLKDMIHIFHDEVVSADSLFYYKQL
ncbi:ABC transporter substrate-binding protein [Aureispira anguillae]|uniref:ABC transporter substrate-binding protein n=1 Tax=Aureispira anguillae TaxID=2864201 RepID=A0A915YDX0_9BACT|nr:ABC transporter substrate-binding protein [Aureispira anguillae]BDS11269.1 ABC transporter substrate-binding protein [Aureispira anguillae]